jgi:hypothetical protein
MRMEARSADTGAESHAALTLNRVAIGVFFAISGYHKLFNAARHATLTSTRAPNLA